MVNKFSKLSLIILVMVLAISASSFGKRKVYFVPIATSIESGKPVYDNSRMVYRVWNQDEQRLLVKRAKQAKLLIAKSLFIDTTDFLAYRNTPEHDRLKEQLRALVDNATAWPEYIYIARLIDVGTTYTYQVLCSSSDIIEQGTLQAFEINENMQLALQLKRPVATDLFSPFQSGPATHAAVYYPFFYQKKPIGILVFVKGNWTERTLTVEERLNILEQKVRNLEFQRIKEKLEELTPDFQGLIED